MLSQYELHQIYRENVTHNQIGGMTDGISPEVAADLGYHEPEAIADFASLPELPIDKTSLLESEAALRGIARAEAMLKHPERVGSEWPSIQISKRSKQVEMPGRNRGRVNRQDRIPTRTEILRHASPRQTATNRAGAELARKSQSDT